MLLRLVICTLIFLQAISDDLSGAASIRCEHRQLSTARVANVFAIVIDHPSVPVAELVSKCAAHSNVT